MKSRTINANALEQVFRGSPVFCGHVERFHIGLVAVGFDRQRACSRLHIVDGKRAVEEVIGEEDLVVPELHLAGRRLDDSLLVHAAQRDPPDREQFVEPP